MSALVPQRRKGARTPYGAAQETFIMKTRAQIDSLGIAYFTTRDWTSIMPPNSRNIALSSTAKVPAHSFYVKPIAAWVPHLILPHFTPTCPHCQKRTDVMTTPRWIQKPKLLYGVTTHRYLDTQYYFCRRCRRDFAGYNEDSLKLDSPELVGIFNFRVSRGFAVDNDLYSFIVSHSSDTTTSIYKRLAQIVTDRWTDDSAFYYRAILANKIRVSNPHTVEGTSQLLMSRFLPTGPPVSAVTKNRMLLQSKVKRLDLSLQSKQNLLDTDFSFTDIAEMKADRNKIDLPFRGLGRGKCKVLVAKGIFTAKDLMNYKGNDPAILPSWIGAVFAYYDARRSDVEMAQMDLSSCQEELDLTSLMEPELAPPLPVHAPNPVLTPPPFSAMINPTGYNARCVSRSTVDRIVTTDFQHRKSLLEAKMKSFPQTVWKIDFHYKLAKKIKVYTGRGCCFSPFQSGVSIHQEDSLAVFWKYYPGT